MKCYQCGNEDERYFAYDKGVYTIVVNVLPLEEWMHMKERRAVIYLHELLK